MRQTSLTRRDFQRLAEMRAAESGVLIRSRKQQGAYYLAGYAIECALKACIAKQARRHEFPPEPDYVRRVYTHNLNELLKLADLDKQLEADMKLRPGLASNWNVVKLWDEKKRYIAAGLKGKDMHGALMGADGVLTWIRQHW